jgi:hypothetical protein
MIFTRVVPEPVYVEETALGKHLSFDILLRNSSDHDLQIQQVDVSILDSYSSIEQRLTVNTNGMRPATETLGEVTLAKNAQLCVFNPFHMLPADLSCAQMHYEIRFVGENGETCSSQFTVSPEPYDTRTNLRLPVRGRLTVLDGHGFYAHHRRVDLTHPILAKHMGFEANSGRFAYDFCPVNASGDLYSGDGESEKDWYGYGVQIYAPGDGRVNAIENTMQDNVLGVRDFDFDQAMDSPDTMMGNYVLIDHLNGEHSVLAHLKQGSVAVQEGETVSQGQHIGLLGFSGSTGPWVHLHYELRTGTNLLTARGLPAYFQDFFRYRGQRRVSVQRGHLDTGDIVANIS